MEGPTTENARVCLMEVRQTRMEVCNAHVYRQNFSMHSCTLKLHEEAQPNH